MSRITSTVRARLQDVIAAFAAFATFAALSGCGDGGKRPIGGTCSDSSECASSLCLQNECIDPLGDEDGDTLTNQLELALGTDPFNADSDGDLSGDGDEVGDVDALRDTDGDGIPDAVESSRDDGDGDCIADQFDPDERDEREERALSVCQRVGLCATYSDQLSAGCSIENGAPLWRCDPSAVPGYGASDTRCDGVDEDCDGETDEDFLPSELPCAEGSCTATAPGICVDGAERAACSVGGTAATDPTCDGVDDDCDGQTDEDFVAGETSCGSGGCAEVGERVCEAGKVIDDCVAGDPAVDDSVCDGVDDDCDGETDEDAGVNVVACGDGACRADGIANCESGEAQVDCTPLDVAASDDATCDGIDGDCDGEVDEDYVATPTSCGVGACKVDGATECIDGAPVAVCVPRVAAADDATCNGVDEDCNGVADEDYVEALTTCGVGACGAVGALRCVGGEVSNTCVAGAASESDVTCEGVDDDCDGATDEDFVAYASKCGRGACAERGTVVCSAGVPEDDCVPGQAPSAEDVACDGIDTNCNGQVDEGYVPLPTSCGVGACAGSGVTTCIDGVVGDSCAAGAGEARDESCDDVDDDCDGETDEDYVPAVTRCGIGGCERTGELGCFAGVTVDSCEPGAPSADTNCNRVDDDCDGGTDESYSGSGTSCGVGICATTGQTSCVDGLQVDGCVPIPGDCAGRQCGSDGCDATCGTCPTPAAPCLTTVCSTSGQCVTTVNARQCYIGGVCVAEGTANPANDCQACFSAVDSTGWTPEKRGTPCADEGNTCTADTCDGNGSCGHGALPDLTACNDSDIATLADWCVSASCRGFFRKVEPKAGPGTEQIYSEAYRRGTVGPSGTAAGQYLYNDAVGDTRGAVTFYGTSAGVVPLTLDPSNAIVALGSTRVVQVDTMWEYAGAKWRKERDNNTLRQVWGYDGNEFPSSFERVLSYATIGINRAIGAGRNAGDSGLVMRACSNNTLTGTPWSCSAQEVFTGDYQSYPAQLVRANSINYLFVNAGSRTSPTLTKVLKYGNGVWSADASLNRSTTNELKDVIFGSGWFIGTGTNTLWVTKLAGYTNIDIPAGPWNWQQAVLWRGNVVVLGQKGSISTTVVLAYCPLDDALSNSSRWKVHTLWTSQTLLAASLVAPNDNELYVLGGDRLGSTFLSPSVRAVWRYTTSGLPIP